MDDWSLYKLEVVNADALNLWSNILLLIDDVISFMKDNNFEIHHVIDSYKWNQHHDNRYNIGDLIQSDIIFKKY